MVLVHVHGSLAVPSKARAPRWQADERVTYLVVVTRCHTIGADRRRRFLTESVRKLGDILDGAEPLDTSTDDQCQYIAQSCSVTNPR